MKILHIAPTPFFADRGCHMRILGEIKHLQSRGNAIVLATYHIGKDINNFNINRIINIPWYKKLEAGGSWHKLYLDILLLWTSIRTFLKLKPDIIHGHLHEGALIGWLVSRLASAGRIPVVFDVQGSLSGEMESYGLIRKKGVLKHVFFVIEKLICKLPDYFVCSAESNRSFLRSAMNLPEKKLVTVLDGIDSDFFYSLPGEKIREEIGIQNSKKIVLYTGSLMQSKGIDYFLESIPEIIKHYHDVHFLIVGHPVEHSRKRVEQLKIDNFIYFTGHVNYFELPKYLHIADVAVDPKVDDAGEGSGKIINYMGAGLPIVCFESVNNRAFLAENGVFAKPRDPADLAAKIVHLLINDEMAIKIGWANQKRVFESFSWEISGEVLLQVYRQAIKDCQK